MDFKIVKTFLPPDPQQKKLTYKKETSEVPFSKKTEKKIKITCFHFSIENQIIVSGTSEGKLYIWERRGLDHKHITMGPQYEATEYSVNNQHKGEIYCVILANVRNQNFYITGSADRTIKLWEADLKNKAIIQTLAGHGGTILQIQYDPVSGTLVSCSIDKSIRVWKLEPGREILFYPSFFCDQTVTHFTEKFLLDTKNLFISSIALKAGDMGTIIAGDSFGTIHFLKQKESAKEFILEESLTNRHRITIVQILLLPKENVIYTISYDQKVLGIELSGFKVFFSYKNPFKTNFTCLAWDSVNHELFVADEIGNVWNMAVHTEGDINKIRPLDRKIIGMEYLEQFSQLVLCTETNIEVMKIHRGVNVQNLIGTHKGPVFKLIELDPKKLTKLPTRDPPRLYSTSLDNTIRVWDIDENQPLNVVDHGNKSEICSMTLLKRSCLFATGHEDGYVKIWNLEIGSYIALETKTKEKPHFDTVCALATGIYSEETNNKLEETEYLFSSGYDGRILVWEILEKKGATTKNSVMGNTITPQLKHAFYPHTEQTSVQFGREILCLIYNPDNFGMIIAAGNSKLIYFCKMHTYECFSIEGHEDSITCMALDKNFLLTGSDDKTIKIWEASSHYYLLYSLDAHHMEPIKDILIIEETGHLVSCAEDGKISVWDYPKSTIVKTFEKKEGFLCLAYSYQMKQLYVGTNSNNILAFPIEDVLKMKVSASAGPIDYKPKLQKKSTKNILQKGLDDDYDGGKIKFNLNESDEYEDDDKIH